VHEMCHAWQYEYGKPGRNGYHNKEWAAKMMEVGLQPYNIRKPQIGTGDAVSDKIITGGRFEKAFEAVPVEYLLPFNCIERLRQKNLAGAYFGNAAGEALPQAVLWEVTSMIERNDAIFAPPKVTKVKYSCSCPEQKNLWGKPGITGIRCEECGALLMEFDAVSDEVEMLKSSGA